MPRAVAVLGGVLLGVNHLLSIGMQAAPSLAQSRAELLCGALVLMLALVPEIEERLREVLPGRGRQATAGSVEGATNAFLLDKQLADKPKQV